MTIKNGWTKMEFHINNLCCQLQVAEWRNKMMVKKIAKLSVAWMMVFTMALTLAGCGSVEDNNRASVTEQNEDNRQQGNDSESDTSPQSAGNGSGKTLVAYFSHSGNTKRIVEDIKEKTGADIFEIKTVNPYSDDYNTVLDEAKKEQKDNARPELSEEVENMEQYETVIIGFPIWLAYHNLIQCTQG